MVPILMSRSLVRRRRIREGLAVCAGHDRRAGRTDFDLLRQFRA
jgi:hypothetical protein